MQIKQLQAIALHCKQLLNVIQNNYISSNPQRPPIEQVIKQRRREIAELKGEIKKIRIQQKQQKQLHKNIRAAQKQLERMKSLTVKEETHYRHLSKLCQRLTQNMLDQKTKANKLAEEEEIMKEFEGYVEEGSKMTTEYEMLRERLNEGTRQSLQMRSNLEQVWRERKQWVKAMDVNNASIDDKIQFLMRQIDVQEEIIEGIHQLERNHQTISRDQTISRERQPIQEDVGSFSILQKQAQVFFQKSTNLSVWERHEVNSLLSRKQLQKQKQVRRIGAIFRQRFTTHHSHESINIQHKSFNFSADLKKMANKSTLERYKPSTLHFVSNDRIRQLERNRRIRTRYTQPAQTHRKPMGNKLKTVVQDSGEEEPDKQSIVSIYQRLKRERDEGTMSVVKFKRLQNKRKSLRKRRGVPIESEHF